MSEHPRVSRVRILDASKIIYSGDDLTATNVEAALDELAYSPGLFASLDAPDDTTCAVADTYYPIEGTFTNAFATGFAGVAGPPAGIEYQGAVTMAFEIDWHASVKIAVGSSTITVGMGVDGTVDTTSEMSSIVVTSGVQMSGTLVVELETDEVVTLYIKSDGAGDVVTVDHFTTTIRAFGR